jgi:spermidine synthase
MVCLLFLTGLCSLIYQICWFREFRLTFGATAMASAAVVAVFIGGLGAGNAVLGRLADATNRPLVLYAAAEAVICVSAAVSPFVIDACRAGFLLTGGEATLGPIVATAVRLAMVGLALAIPTFFMGGTLPFAARGIVTPGDASRRRVALLYGMNTLGGVAGAVLATFVLIEAYGTRTTLWIACVVNLAMSGCAFLVARWACPLPRFVPEDGPAATPEVPVWFVSAMACGTGFIFFLMELVWYRLLGPILGGTTFTFGLILAMALLGVGLGGAAYAFLFVRRAPSRDALATSCLLEALGLAVPFALGDRLALLAGTLREANTGGFVIEVLGWALVAGIVILPAAFVSGVQFPLLIGLLGRGGRDVGGHVGQAFMWNAVGCILGSLAGGFGFLPLLSAPGAWRVMAIVLVVLGVTVKVMGHRGGWAGLDRGTAVSGVVVAAVLGLLACEGPTAVWRHAGIGAGRSRRLHDVGANALREWTHAVRRGIQWEADGIEACVGITNRDGLSFLVNGKSDGHAVHDAGTQIGLAVIGAALHPAPKTACVVGLGTGETAGWLAAVDTIERVDVAELEPAVVEMARRCSLVNHDAVNHPKVRIIFNDAREMLLTGRERYDLIACEPSNPYRSGVANLFTKEFYKSARGRLAEGGFFLQWLQAYEVDSGTFRSVLATFAEAFAHVDMWQTLSNDLILVGCEKPPVLRAEALRSRVNNAPFPAAFVAGWHVTGLEGLLSRFVGGPRLVSRLLAEEGAMINTDDRNCVEFGFARSLGRRGLMSSVQLRDMSHALGDDRYPLVFDRDDAPVAWREAELARQWDLAMAEDAIDQMGEPSRPWIEDEVVLRYANGDVPGMLEAWENRKQENSCLTESSVIARGYAERGDTRAIRLIERVREVLPAEAAVLTAKLSLAAGDARSAAASLQTAFEMLRADPWMMPGLRERAFAMADGLSHADPSLSLPLLRSLSEPFAVDVARESRISCCSRIAATLGAGETVPFVAVFEPFVPWKLPFLEFRRKIYAEVGHPFVERAARDIATFRKLAAEDAARRASR